VGVIAGVIVLYCIEQLLQWLGARVVFAVLHGACVTTVRHGLWPGYHWCLCMGMHTRGLEHAHSVGCSGSRGLQPCGMVLLRYWVSARGLSSRPAVGLLVGGISQQAVGLTVTSRAQGDRAAVQHGALWYLHAGGLALIGLHLYTYCPCWLCT
jgi:hypothetical protein